MARPPKTLIGWREWCALPDLDLPAIRTKIDTGARTSALHAFDIEIKKDIVRFSVHPIVGHDLAVSCKAKLVEERIIVSSNGERELRPVILSTIAIGPVSVFTEITLTCRRKMNYRMLLGRKALRAAKLNINPARSFLMGRIEDEICHYKKN